MAYYNYIIATYGFSQEIIDFVYQAYGALETEYAWWMSQDAKHTQLFIVDGSFYKLNHYQSSGDTPRPESYYQDVTTAQSSS